MHVLHTVNRLWAQTGKWKTQQKLVSVEGEALHRLGIQQHGHPGYGQSITRSGGLVRGNGIPIYTRAQSQHIVGNWKEHCRSEGRFNRMRTRRNGHTPKSGPPI